jgi:hypothetical protein
MISQLVHFVGRHVAIPKVFQSLGENCAAVLASFGYRAVLLNLCDDLRKPPLSYLVSLPAVHDVALRFSLQLSQTHVFMDFPV